MNNKAIVKVRNVAGVSVITLPQSVREAASIYQGASVTVVAVDTGEIRVMGENYVPPQNSQTSTGKPAMTAEEIEQSIHKDRVTKLCEDLFRIVVSAVGGIPRANGTDSVGRQIVREARAMYAEIEKPTAARAGRRRGAVTAQDPDETDIDTDDIEEYAEFTADD